MEHEREARKTGKTEVGTVVAAALVLKTTFEAWPSIKRAVEAAGAEIIFEKMAPRWSRLWIVEKEPEANR